MRAFLICAVLIAVTSVVSFTLGLYAIPQPVQQPCEVIPVKATQPMSHDWRAL